MRWLLWAPEHCDTEDEGRGRWSTVHPGISQPEPPPFLAAPEHSPWPTATEVRACQDARRRKKTRHRKQNKTKEPRPWAGRGTDSWTQAPRFGRHPAARDPGGEGNGSMSCCSAQGELLSRPETPTHWPLVSFFFKSFFFLIPKPLIFKALKKNFFFFFA